MKSSESVIEALARLDIRSTCSALAGRWWMFTGRWPAVEDIRGDFFRTVGDVRELRSFFARSDSVPDTSRAVPEFVRGSCYVCGRDVDFVVDTELIRQSGNWRETLKCPGCGLINRWRSSFHLFEVLLNPRKQDRIYLTEAVTPLFKAISERYPRSIGSEYAPGVTPGTEIELPSGPTRIEDVTALSFPDRSFRAVLSFDVLEHVPDFKSALREFHRVLAPGGQVLITAPFTFVENTVTRARTDPDGNVRHLMEPNYHGDPLSDQGVLCYYEFGMELLQDMRDAGFLDAFLVCYTSLKWAYYDEHVTFVGRKGA